MPELALAPPPPHAELVRQVRDRIGELLPHWRLIAEGILGADAAIDLVGAGPDGRVVLVLVGARGDDLELVGHAIAQRAWVASRLRDWLQLAPDLAIRPELGVAVLLLCPEYRGAAVAAARALGPDALRLGIYRTVRDGSATGVLLEPFENGQSQVEHPNAPSPASPGGAPFRTGLRDADLDLTREELREFE